MRRAHYPLSELGSRLMALPRESASSGRILIVDEEGDDYRQALAETLPNCHFTLETSPETARQLFLASPFDLVILSHSERISCLEWLPMFKSLRPSVSVIVTTACGCEELAVQAFRHGAIDYFSSPFESDELEMSIRAILEIRKKFTDCGKPLPVSGLQRALRYMESNFQSPMSLDDAAGEAGMSVSCFERYLKNQTGMTFTAYLNSMRIARAKELLQADHAPMLQIALACGFSNQSHFNRVFRKVAGVTPGEYRKVISGKAGKS
ncbi:MAG TPA: helix-turn-helix domain-containing protein [Geobacteraceae bacterium]|nr:helix-turn-helix domain-containing protein [Geobacteraceae bacterium]